MKITIKSILKENVSNKEEEAYQRFLKGVAKRIKPPYIKNMMAYDVPELDWHEVFDEIFGVGVYVYTWNDKYQVIDNINNNVLYEEDAQLYVGNEPLSVDWTIYEYNSKHCPLDWTYEKKSNNRFIKRELDDSGKTIYWEDEEGVKLDKRNEQSLNESYLQTHIKYLKGVAQRMKHPFMKELNSYGVDKSDWELVLSYKLGTNVSIQVREDTMVVSDRVHKVTIYDEYVSPYNDRFWSSAYYDEDGRQIYGIDSNGVVMDRTIEPPYYRD